jgi:hypothetical protein
MNDFAQALDTAPSLISHFAAFSSREPMPTSLENGLI